MRRVHADNVTGGARRGSSSRGATHPTISRYAWSPIAIKRWCVPALALLLVGGSCTADTGVSTSDSVPAASTVATSTTVTSVPEPVTTTSSTTASSTSAPPPQRCVISEISASSQSEYWRPVMLDEALYRLDVVTGALTELAQTVGVDGFEGLVPFEDTVLVAPGHAQLADTGWEIELVDLTTGTRQRVGLGDVGPARLVGMLGDTALFGGWSRPIPSPVLVGYDLAVGEIVWVTELAPKSVDPETVDEAIPAIYSAETSPLGDVAVVRLAFPTSVEFDVLVDADGTRLTNLFGEEGLLTWELHGRWDRTAGWFDENMLLYAPVDGPAYLVDSVTLERQPIEMPDLRAGETLFASGDGVRVLVTGEAGMAMFDLEAQTRTPLVSAPCYILIGTIGSTGNSD